MGDILFLALGVLAILTICVLGLVKIKNSKKGIFAKILLGFIGAFILLALAWFAYTLLYWGPKIGKM